MQHVPQGKLVISHYLRIIGSRVIFYYQLRLMERQTVPRMTMDNKISSLRRVEMEVAHHHTDLLTSKEILMSPEGKGGKGD